MKYLITESNLKGLLEKSFGEYGFKNTVNRFKLSLPQILNLYKDSELPEFDCQDLREICGSLINGGFVNLSLNKGAYGVYIETDDGGEYIQFNMINHINNEGLSGYATPFFDGYCKLPVEIETFRYIDDESSEEIEEPYHYSEDIKVRSKFKSFEDIIDWLNTKYFLYILKVCEKL